MKSVTVFFDNAEEVWRFVNILRKYEGDYDLAAGRYTVDAKSILGVCALGIGKTLELQMINPKGEEESLLTELKSYLVS